MRILIVDDSADHRRIYRRLLESDAHNRFEFFECGFADQALAMARNLAPDCILLDFALPDHDGTKLLDKLRDSDALMPIPIPVILMSGVADDAVGWQAIRAGAQDFIRKEEITGPVLGRIIRHAIERHALQTAMREHALRATAIVNTAVDAIVTFDEDGHVETFNPAAEPLFGWAAEEVIGQRIDVLLPELFTAERMHERHLKRGEQVGRHSDGTTFPVEVAVSVLHLDHRRVFTAITRDITARKRAEEQQKLFLAATSHDVRNSLTVISGLADMVAHDLLDGEARGSLQRIISLSRTLSEVMYDLLQHSESRTARVIPSPTCIRQLIADSARDFEEPCRERGLELRVELPPATEIITDRPKVMRVLQNLLSNAVRYTPDGWISLSAVVEDGHVQIAVADTGIGISPEVAPRLFDDYYRHPAARQLEPLGTGLGLSTVKRFCEALGGGVRLEEGTGDRGSRFVVTFPSHLVRSPAGHPGQ